MAQIKISLIIPFHGDDTFFLQKTLPFLRANAPWFYEIIIVSASPGYPRIAASNVTNLRLFESKKGRGLQMAYGADQAKGDWLLFLHADTILTGLTGLTGLTNEWQNAISAHISAYPKHGATFALRFYTPHKAARRIERWAAFRGKVLNLPYGDQGLLLSRTLYQATGGFRRDYPLMEDVDIIRRIGHRKLKHLPAAALTSFEKYTHGGAFKHGLRNLICLSRFFLGTPPETLYRQYYKK